jgi:peptidoglycan hydrolase CwlO-like protein
MRKGTLLILITVMVFLLFAILASCGNKEEKSSDAALQHYRQQMEAKLDQLQKKIQDLGEQIKGKKAEMRTALENQLEGIKKQGSETKAKLETLKQKGGETLEQVKKEISEQMDKLEASYEDLKRHLQGS